MYQTPSNLYRYANGSAQALIPSTGTPVQGTLSLSGTAGSALYAAEYEYDKLGRIVQQQETVQSQTVTEDYAYDLAGRLTEVRQNGMVTATTATPWSRWRTACRPASRRRADPCAGQRVADAA